MTVQSSLARQSYTIAGAGPYTIPFYFLANADIIAIRTPVGGGNPVTLTLTTHYTLLGAGDEGGGALTLDAGAVVNGDTLTIINEPTILQLTQYPETGKFPAASHERALDRLTMIAKRVYDLASRSLRLNDGYTATSLELPVSSPGKLIGWDSGGNLINTSPTAVGSGSIGTTEIADGAVTVAKIADGAVTLAKINNAQLTTLAGITAQQATDLASLSTFMGTVLNDADAATARATLGITSTAFASSAENAAGTIEDKAVDPLGIREAFNATGTAPVYACRAWVNFNGTGTVAIRASGNVSSITDNGTGDYTINFTTAMPDANYAPVLAGTYQSQAASQSFGFNGSVFATTSFRVLYQYGGAAADAQDACIAVLR